MNESKLTKGDSAVEGQDTELETAIGNVEHLVLLAAISTRMRGSDADGGEGKCSRTATNEANALQHDDSSAQMTSEHSRNSTYIAQNPSPLISMATSDPAVVGAPQAKKKRMTKKRKNRHDDNPVGSEAKEICRSQEVDNYQLEHSHPEQLAASLTQLNTHPHASAIGNRTILNHFYQSMPMTASNTTRMPQDSVSMHTAYAAASVGPVHPMQTSNLVSALRQQQTARIAATLQFFLANPTAALNPVLSTSQRPAIPPLPETYGLPLPPQMLATQGFQPLTPPVLSSLLLQQHLLPTRNLLDLHQYHPRPNHHSTANSSPLQVAATFGPRMLPCSAPTHHHTSGLGGLSTLQSGGVVHHAFPTTDATIGPYGALLRPAILFQASDETKLSPYQILLRQQIEVFCASEDDVTSHARGRNKPITLRQVGIRCRHCSRTTWNRREKGSAYFPHSLQGMYQAAQNMGSSHFNDPICSQMPAALKMEFAVAVACKSSVGSGKHYWAESARKLGLVDTDRGIRTIFDAVNGVL